MGFHLGSLSFVIFFLAVYLLMSGETARVEEAGRGERDGQVREGNWKDERVKERHIKIDG